MSGPIYRPAFPCLNPRREDRERSGRDRLRIQQPTLCVQGKLEDALDQHKQALQLAERSGNPWQQARAHDGKARVLAALGDLDSARASWQRALVLHTELGTREVDVIAAQLTRIGPSKRQKISIFSELPAATAPADPRS